MSDRQEALPADVQAALARGNRIEAIRLMRAATGMSLAEAKAAIEGPAAAPGVAGATPPTPEDLPAEVAAALATGNKIEAIKLLRAATGMELKDAKDAVDAAVARGAGLAPGEIPRRSWASLLPWLVLGLVALGVYVYLRPA